MSQRHDRRGHEHPSTWGVLLWWLAYVAIYLSFVEFVWTQLVAGAGAAAVAVALSLMGMRAAGITFTGALPRLWRGRAVGAILAREVRAVLRALARQVRGGRPVSGRFVAVPVGEPVDAATDSAITLEASVAPNTYVVAVLDAAAHGRDGPGELLLLHQFEPKAHARRSFPRWHP